MSNDLISIIVPVYKVEPYLDRCVQSIVDQTYSNLEIILIDDGSPDNCPAMCDAWAAKDNRIKVIHKGNGGLSDARNAGIAIASGEYIAFVDSDDTIEKDYLEMLYRALLESNAEIAECGAAYVAEDGSVIRYRRVAPLSEMDKIEALRRLVLEDGIYQTVWNKLYRRSVIKDIPFPVGKCHEDEFWTYQVVDRIKKLATVNKPLYNYLQRSSSIIGVGYNIRRLDGLEARYQRMEYLQKYEELAAMTRQQIIFDCMWHYQSSSRTLLGEEKKRALIYIRQLMRKTEPVPMRKLTGKLTHRIWFVMFKYVPDFTVKFRTKLGIGE